MTRDTLNSVDADGDGVWGDMQAWIVSNFEPGSDRYFALRQVARALQLAVQNAESEEISLRLRTMRCPLP
ncbi:hypothetical protein [Sedimentimonas flavescens]|uniref:hypothetical protein n=1 Tax=Sedimentimonas flavescens TaxID=2851012 RepID=UPI0021A926DD|nr:hypothetical protein [Sedimentimonas flavescens]MCT2541076.1 hypothetical protein [Sedimentimonas flavescens]